ncbi:hypothetical protein ASC77_23725 [Nocardioides sp. Root1257]|nr:hypothetical protein ASC77_23725 [Nocardioides sp. Root1257]KRC39929.1 hypothetical protein ASE24_23520 [Nocardioides sp. Root224]
MATPAQARAALYDESGIVHSVPSGTRPLVAVMSTISPEVVKEFADAALTTGIRIIDAPVSGGPPRAADGTLSVLVAGTETDIEEARPALSALGAVFECGAVGNAQTLKLVNNMVCAANLVITGEAYRLALECGLDLDDVTDVLEVSTGRNFLSDGRGTAQSYLRGWTQSREAYDATLAIVRKDVGLAIELAGATPGAYVGLAGIAEIMASLGDATFDDWKVAATGITPEGRA